MVVTDFVTEAFGHKTLGQKMDLWLNRSQIMIIFLTEGVVTLWDCVCNRIIFKTYLVTSFLSEKFKLGCDNICNHIILVTDFVIKLNQIIYNQNCYRSLLRLPL